MTITKYTPGHPYGLTVDRADLEQNGLHADLFEAGQRAARAHNALPPQDRPRLRVGQVRAAAIVARLIELGWSPPPPDPLCNNKHPEFIFRCDMPGQHSGPHRAGWATWATEGHSTLHGDPT